MKHRIILISLAFLFGVVIYLTVFLKNPGSNGLCINSFSCEDFWNFGVRLPIYYGLQYFVGSLLLISIFSFSYVKIWMKFTIPFLLVGLLVIISTPTDCDAPLMLCFNKLNITHSLGKLLIILTVIIILSKYIYNLYISRKNKIIS